MKKVFGPITGFKVLEGPEGAPNRLDLKIDSSGIEQAIMKWPKIKRTLHPFDKIKTAIENDKLVLTLSEQRYVLEARNPAKLIQEIDKFRNRSTTKKQAELGSAKPTLKSKIVQGLVGLLLLAGIVTVLAVMFEDQIADYSAKINKQAEVDAPNAPEAEKEKTINRANSLVLRAFGGEIKDDKSSGVALAHYSPEMQIPEEEKEHMSEEPIPSVTQIQYRYYPIGIGSLSSEIASILSNRLQRLYDSSNLFDHVRLGLYLPFSDNYGNITWDHAALIVMSRATYNKINWENFDTENLWNVADEVSREKWIVWD